MSTETRGRKPTFADTDALVHALRDIESGKHIGRYLSTKLVTMGFVEASTIKSRGRGRPRIVYILSEKGRQQIG